MAHSTASPQGEAAQPPPATAPTFLHLWEGTASSGSATLCVSCGFRSHRRPSVLARVRRHHSVLRAGRARTLEAQGAARALGVPLAPVCTWAEGITARSPGAAQGSAPLVPGATSPAGPGGELVCTHGLRKWLVCFRICQRT